MTAIVDYGAGNTKSVMNALDRLEAEYILTSNYDKIQNADRLILPGVGHAKAAMEQLKSRNLINVLIEYKKPFLGICLGMQLMFEHSEEGNTECLGLIPDRIRKFNLLSGFKVPHMGWNDFAPDVNCNLFSGLPENIPVYFVHSYYAEITEYSMGICDYIQTFCAAITCKNFFGLQFHPEKSGVFGEQIMKNFINLKN